MLSILDLVDDLLIYLLRFLDNKSVKNLALTNKFFFEITKKNKIIEIFSKGSNVKGLSFINHCDKITSLYDNSLDCKFYLKNYNKLFINNLKKINISSCVCMLGRSEISQLLENNSSLTHLTININFYGMEINYYENISQLKKLEYLSITDSALTDMQLKQYIEKIKTIKSLHLINFPNIYLFNLFLPNLKQISIIRCNNIDYEFLTLFIKTHPHIYNLDLSNMSINIQTSLIIAKHAKQLTHLNLSYSDNVINDLDLAVICSHCENLIYLNLCCTFITDKSMISLGIGCLKLKTLIISYTGVSNIGVRNLLSKIKNLRFIDLTHTLITREIINYLKEYPFLVYKVEHKLIKEKLD